MIELRAATLADGPALVAIDRATWSPTSSPAPMWSEHRAFFERTDPADVVVAEEDGVIGYLTLQHPTPLESHRHVLQINGVAVDPRAQGRGIGRMLLDAGIMQARSRGARRLTLRVLGDNLGAQRLYQRCGFVVEGVLPGEFYLAGSYVDDIMMGLRL